MTYEMIPISNLKSIILPSNKQIIFIGQMMYEQHLFHEYNVVNKIMQ